MAQPPGGGKDLFLPGFHRTTQILRWLGMLKPSPRVTGEVLVEEGLQHPVEVRWDDAGVPHIMAQGMDDALFAQGFLHARERAFQMDLSRRLPAGELAELLGEAGLPYDRFMRRLNLKKWAQLAPTTWSPETLAHATSYIKGVNLAFQQILPAEHRLLKEPLRPWTLEDTNLLVYQLAWTLNSIWTAKWGFEAAKEWQNIRDWLFGPLPSPGVTIIPGTGAGVMWGTRGIGSNNWVVDGAHSKTGKPLLANDPHLAPQLPSIWYEMFIEGGSLRVFGASLPGAPGIVIGQNRDIAWGVTNVDPDVQDLYRIEMDPDGKHYRVDGELQELEVRQETLKIRGKADETIIVETSHTGPIIHTEKDGKKIALNWTGFQALPVLESIFGINKAHDWETFVFALAEWWVPAQNFVYADQGGHIGYICAGQIPIHDQGPFLGVADGNTRSTGWTGIIEWTDMPRLFDPPNGFAVSANNPVIGDRATPYIAGRYSLGHRAQRITTLLEATPQHDAESFAKIQQDVYSEPLYQISQRLLQFAGLPESWRNLLVNFDGQTRLTSPVPTMLYLFMVEGLPKTLKDFMDRPFFPAMSPGMPGSHPFPETFWDLLGERIGPLLLSLWDQVDIAGAINRASEVGRQVFGPDLKKWQWGQAHQTIPFHPFSAVKMLRPVFSRQALPTPGDFYTPFQAAFSLEPRLDWPRSVLFMPSYRQILNLGNPKESVAIHLTGQAGHPLSHRYDNLLAPYQEGKYFALGPGMQTARGFEMLPKSPPKDQ